MRRTALITGASGGIGGAAALRLARDGFQVAVHYHQNERAALELTGALAAQGLPAMAVQADIADAAAVRAMVERVEAQWGTVDVLVNNAGVGQQKLLPDVTDAEWDRILAVNLTGAFYCCRAVLPQMIRRQAGCIVNVSSMWGRVGASCEAAYSAAKAGLIGLTKALAKEVGPSGIRVNCVAPGVIDTPMNGALDDETLLALREETPLGRIGTPEETAAVIAFLTSEDARFLTGQVIGADGGFAIG